MKKYISKMTAPTLIAVAMFVPVVMPTTASAIDVFPACSDSTVSKDSAVCKSKDEKADGLVKIVVNTLLYVLGAIAVIMIVVGGIRYTTSNGDANGIKSAKDTILYSVIGLVVAMMAWAIVNFVVTQFG